MGSLKRAFHAVLPLLALVVLPAFVACGGGGSSTPPPPTAPAITTQPASQTVLEGDTATFTVVASGTAPLNYQWSKGGTAISGATSASYPTPATVLADSGSTFTVTVSNSAGSVTSSAATLTVYPKPVITSFTPNPATITAGGSATLAFAFAGGTGSIDQGVGAVTTGTNVTVTPSATTTYTLTVDNGHGTTKTATATVTVAPVPVAPALTVASTITAGKAGLTASVTTPQAGITYTWALTGGTITAGQGTTQVTFTAGAVGTATLTCTATNAAGATAPTNATLTVVAAPVATSLTPSTASPLYGATVTLTPVFSGGSATVDQGIGTVLSTNTYTSSAITSATTFTLTVTNAANDIATAQAVVTPQTVTVSNILGNQNLTVSTTFTYSASVGGAANTTLNWYVDGVAGGNATAGTITSGGLYTAPANAGSHTIKAVAAADGTTNATLSVNIYSAPDATITVPASVASGATGLTASVPLQSAGTIYGWSITNGTGSGTITSSLTGQSITFTAGTVGTFTLNCTVTNPAGTTKTGNTTVTVVQAPVINSFNANPTGVVSGGAVTLSFNFAGGAGSIDNGVGTVNSGVDVTVHPTTTTTYTLTVTPTVGSPSTQSVTVTVSTALTYSTNLPATGSVNVGSSFTFTVAVSGTPAVNTFTWYHNGNLTANTSTGSYTIPSAASGDAGNWYVVAGNGITTVTSNTLSLTVNVAAGNVISGQVGVVSNAGWSPVSNITVTLGGASTAITTTDGSGYYAFTGLPDGSYTVTPSLVNTGVSAWFLPGSQNILLHGSSQTADFQVNLGYSVSGTVTYSGSRTGRIYLVLNAGGSVSNGVSITSPGAFTIRGVPPGNYTLTAFMDIIGLGNPNANDPRQSTTISFSVSSAPVTGISVNLVDPSPASLTSGPSLQRIMPFNGGALVDYAPLRTSGVEIATSYDLQWSTVADFSTVAGALTLVAGGDNNMCFASGMTDGVAYYFRMRGNVGTTHGPWGTTSTAVTIGMGTGFNNVSGTITLPAVPTGPLAVALVAEAAQEFHLLVIPSPSQIQAYTITGVPNGSYLLYGILDQNHNGVIDPGDITNTSGNGLPVTVSGNLGSQNLTLSGAASLTQVATQHWKNLLPGGTSEGYGLRFWVNDNVKLPVNVTLQPGPNARIDVGINTGGDRYQYGVLCPRPTIGDTYSIQLGYSDGTSETLSPAVTAVLDAFAQQPTPTTGTSTSTQPTFTWAPPAAPPSFYFYSLWIAPQGGGNIWDLWGMPSSQLSVIYNSDGTASQPSLTPGTTYTWSIGVNDADGNVSALQIEYRP